MDFTADGKASASNPRQDEPQETPRAGAEPAAPSFPRISEEQLWRSLDHISTGVGLLSLDGRFLRVNQGLCDMVGYKAAALIGRNFRDITHEDVLGLQLEQIQLLLEGRISSYKLPKQYWHHERKVVDALVHVSLVRDEQGRPQYFLGLSEDITESTRQRAELQHKTLILEAMLATTQDPVIVSGADGRTLLCNAAAQGMLGDEGHDCQADSAHHGLFAAGALTPMAESETPTARALAGEHVHQCELLVRNAAHPEGRWYSFTASPFFSAERRIGGAVTIANDVSSLKETEIALRAQIALVRLLEAVAVAANEASSSRGAMQECLRLVCQHTTWPIGHVYLVDGPKLIPSDLWYLADRDHFEPFREATMRTQLSVGLGLPGRVLALGKPTWMEDVQADHAFVRMSAAVQLQVRGGFAFPVLASGEVAAVLEFFSEQPTVVDARTLKLMQHVGSLLGRVVERERHAEAVRSLSLTDELTGLNNRRGFFAAAEPQLRIAARAGRTSLLLFLDMDGLKQINDQLGHEIGDLAIVELAGVLRSTFRESDVLGRLGGDEFVVLLPDASSTHEARVVARFQESLAQHGRRAQRGYVLAASVGVTAFDPRQPAPLEELLSRADARMYEQKRARKEAAPRGT